MRSCMMLMEPVITPTCRGTGFAFARFNHWLSSPLHGLVRFVGPGLVHVGVEVDGDHHLGSHGAGQEMGTRLTTAPSTSQRSSTRVGVSRAGHTAGGAHTLAKRPLPATRSRDRYRVRWRRRQRQRRRGFRWQDPQMAGGDAKYLVTAKQAAGEGRIEQPHDLQAAEAAHPALQLVQFTSGIGGADKAADGAASHQIRLLTPESLRARMMPMWAHPRAAPLPRANPRRGFVTQLRLLT